MKYTKIDDRCSAQNHKCLKISLLKLSAFDSVDSVYWDKYITLLKSFKHYTNKETEKTLFKEYSKR